MLNIKISIPNFNNNINISQFVGNNENIGWGCKFYINDSTLQEADYWFVVEDLQLEKESVNVNKECLYFISAEAIHEKGSYDGLRLAAFLDQFSNIITCHDIYRKNAKYDLPFLPWMINANHGSSIYGTSPRDVNWFKENHDLQKTKCISVFCSNQQQTVDHRMRLKFVNAIKNKFGEKIDWYGNGINSIPEKWSGIAPYKYHIVLENQSRNNIITEKLYDCYLGLAYPIYYGAPNVSNYFDPESLTLIDIADLNGSVNIIEQLIEKNVWEEKKEVLISSKMKVLGRYNIFNRIANISKNAELSSAKQDKHKIILRSINHLSPRSFGQKLATRSGILLRHISDMLLKVGG